MIVSAPELGVTAPSEKRVDILMSTLYRNKISSVFRSGNGYEAFRNYHQRDSNLCGAKGLENHCTLLHEEGLTSPFVKGKN